MTTRRFTKKFQGYDPAEVDEALAESGAELHILRQKAEDLSRSVVELETQLKDYRALEKAMQQTLRQAQETSATAMEQARKEARMIIQEAEMKAARIVEKSKTDLTVLNEQVTIMKAKKESIVNRLTSLLKSELDLVKTLSAEPERVPPDDQISEAGQAGKSGQAAHSGIAGIEGGVGVTGRPSGKRPPDLDEILKNLSGGKVEGSTGA